MDLRNCNCSVLEQLQGGARMNEMTEKEMDTVKKATIYELRLLITQGEKTDYTREELVELLDKIAMAKEQKIK
jgi:hypothetical protein